MSQESIAGIYLRKYRRLWFLLPLLLLLFIILLLAFILPGRQANRGLKPFRPSPTPGPRDLTGEPTVLTFTELNDAPQTYRGQRIQVTGEYQALTPPDCHPYSGPIFRWSLVAENLQLNSRGFEDLLKYVPDGTTLTVEGIWRLYDGPLGCGKQAADDIAWYLAVERIVSPNPLPNFVRTPHPTAVSGESPANPTTPTPGETPMLTATPTLPDVVFTPLATPTAVFSGTAVSTPTPQITGTPGTGTVYPSVTPLVSATPTGFPPGFPSPTPGPGTPSATPPVGATTPAPIGTSPPQPTNPAYPGATTAPTATSGSYP